METLEEDSPRTAAIFNTRDAGFGASPAEEASHLYRRDNAPGNHGLINYPQGFDSLSPSSLANPPTYSAQNQSDSFTTSFNNQLSLHPHERERNEMVGRWIQHMPPSSARPFPEGFEPWIPQPYATYQPPHNAGGGNSSLAHRQPYFNNRRYFMSYAGGDTGMFPERRTPVSVSRPVTSNRRRPGSLLGITDTLEHNVQDSGSRHSHSEARNTPRGSLIRNIAIEDATSGNRLTKLDGDNSVAVDALDSVTSVHKQGKARAPTASASSKTLPKGTDYADDEGLTPNAIDDFEPDFAGFRQHVQHLFPNMSEYLADRIAHCQVIRYRNLLAEKVKHMSLGANCPCGPLCVALDGAAIALSRDQSLKGSDRIPAQGDAIEEPLATDTLHSESFPKDIPMPPTKSLPAELECQLCYLPQKIKKASDWTKHVHQDLRSYTCTWEHCRAPAFLWRIADWTRHENEAHRRLEWWTCDIESCRHTVYRKGNFIQHLVREHQYAEPRMYTRAAIKRSAKEETTLQKIEQCHHATPKQPDDEPCKFCGKTFSTWKNLTGHMAKHMQHIALPVIRLVNKKAKDITADTSISPVRELSLQFADGWSKAPETGFLPYSHSHRWPTSLELHSQEVPAPHLYHSRFLTELSYQYVPNVNGVSGAQTERFNMVDNEGWLYQDLQPLTVSLQGTTPADESHGTNMGDRRRQTNVNSGPDSSKSFPSVTPPRHSLDSGPLRRETSTSRSCDETTSADEWLSLSMEDASDIDVSKHIPHETRAKAVLHFLNSFIDWRGYANFWQCGASAAKKSAGVSGSAAELSQSSGSGSNLMHLKRKQGNSEEEYEDDNGSRKKKTPNPRAGSTNSADENKLLFACPFYKWKPLPYRPCRAKVLKEISRVKQHLWRYHRIPIYCPRCFSEFAAEDERDTHIREVNCEIQERKMLEGVTAEQKAKLTRRVNTKLTRRDQWNEMYTILFPGEPLPTNPYISEGLLSQELTALQDFMAQQWPTEFELFIANGGIPDELKGHEDVLQTFSASLFEEVVGSTMQQFEEWQQKNKAASSSSGYKSDSTPQQEEPNEEDAPALCDPAKTPILPIEANIFAKDDENGHAWAVWGSEQLGCDKHSEFNIFEAVFGSNKDEYGEFLGSVS